MVVRIRAVHDQRLLHPRTRCDWDDDLQAFLFSNNFCSTSAAMLTVSQNRFKISAAFYLGCLFDACTIAHIFHAFSCILSAFLVEYSSSNQRQFLFKYCEAWCEYKGWLLSLTYIFSCSAFSVLVRFILIKLKNWRRSGTKNWKIVRSSTYT
jgi:hypothetical protein